MEILFEDNHLIAINKMVGEIVQGDKTGDEPLNEKLQHFLKEKYQKPGNVYVGTLHRLDRPVCGALLFAKTSKAAERMSKQFAAQKVDKTYYAICHNAPREKEGIAEDYLLKNSRLNQVQAFKNQVANSKKAVLHYQHIGEIAGKHLLKVTPKTGRPHQIRVQLATLGCTILGDVKYGSNYKTPNRSLYLFCQQLGFEHPVKKEHTVIEAPWPLFGFWNTLLPVLKDQ